MEFDKDNTESPFLNFVSEEFHRGALSNAEIPYDYKIYTFQGIIGFITKKCQI